MPVWQCGPQLHGQCLGMLVIIQLSVSSFFFHASLASICLNVISAVAINDRLSYSLVELEPPEGEPEAPRFGKGTRNVGKGLLGNNTKYLVVAEDLVERLAEKFGRGMKILGSFPGSALEHST